MYGLSFFNAMRFLKLFFFLFMCFVFCKTATINTEKQIINEDYFIRLNTGNTY